MCRLGSLCFLTINLVPRALVVFKIADGETAGQGCQNSFKLPEYFKRDEMSKSIYIARNKHDCVSLVKKPPKTPFQSVSRDKILHGSWNMIFWSLDQQFLRPSRHFESREGPGNEVSLTIYCSVVFFFFRRDEKIHRGIR